MSKKKKKQKSEVFYIIKDPDYPKMVSIQRLLVKEKDWLDTSPLPGQTFSEYVQYLKEGIEKDFESRCCKFLEVDRSSIKSMKLFMNEYSVKKIPSTGMTLIPALP